MDAVGVPFYRLTGVRPSESIRPLGSILLQLFWLGSTRGRQGYEVLKRVVALDTSDRVREKASPALDHP